MFTISIGYSGAQVLQTLHSMDVVLALLIESTYMTHGSEIS